MGGYLYSGYDYMDSFLDVETLIKRHIRRLDEKDNM